MTTIETTKIPMTADQKKRKKEDEVFPKNAGTGSLETLTWTFLALKFMAAMICLSFLESIPQIY